MNTTPDSDSSHNTSESVDLTNLDSTDYGCEIRLVHGWTQRQTDTKINGLESLAYLSGLNN